jgi:ferric-dicitrate binding protein FerR (iron transport regulator)
MAKIEFDNNRVDNYYKGADSVRDESYIQDVFTDDSCVKSLKGLLKRQFNELSAENDEDRKKLDHILYKIHYDINTRFVARRHSPFSPVIKWALSTAVAILLPLVVFMGIKDYRGKSISKETRIEIVAPAWTRAQFSLPDGTKGWLNSSSSIAYSGDFIDNRQISLHGEAYFDVAKDDQNPFTVFTLGTLVKVLGTRFNVAAYDNEQTVEVVLEEGKLLFSDSTSGQTVAMNSNDLAVYHKKGNVISIEEVNPQKFVSWTEGKLIFRNDPLDVVARRLERWYNVVVDLDVSGHEEIRWRATFQDDSLEEVLKILKRSLHIDFRIQEGMIRQDGTVDKKKVILSARNN